VCLLRGTIWVFRLMVILKRLIVCDMKFVRIIFKTQFVPHRKLRSRYKYLPIVLAVKPSDKGVLYGHVHRMRLEGLTVAWALDVRACVRDLWGSSRVAFYRLHVETLFTQLLYQHVVSGKWYMFRLVTLYIKCLELTRKWLFSSRNM
jgi:hypothetical protein